MQKINNFYFVDRNKDFACFFILIEKRRFYQGIIDTLTEIYIDSAKKQMDGFRVIPKRVGTKTLKSKRVKKKITEPTVPIDLIESRYGTQAYQFEEEKLTSEIIDKIKNDNSYKDMEFEKHILIPRKEESNNLLEKDYFIFKLLFLNDPTKITNNINDIFNEAMENTYINVQGLITETEKVSPKEEENILTPELITEAENVSSKEEENILTPELITETEKVSPKEEENILNPETITETENVSSKEEENILTPELITETEKVSPKED